MTTTISDPTAASVKALAGKYLTFRLGDESYGIQVLKIREIIRRTAVTAVPQMPPYILGVINLRGKIIPVLDLRVRFGLDGVKDAESNCIIVAQVTLPGRAALQTGVMVDAVEEVINIAAGDIEETPDFGASMDTAYILGMAKVKGAVKTLLDIDRVIGADTADQLHEAASH